MQSSIEKSLKENLSPSLLEVINESHLHANHQDFPNEGETHFAIKIVSETFRGKSKLQQHKMVYKALSHLFQKGLHSVRIESSIPF